MDHTSFYESPLLVQVVVYLGFLAIFMAVVYMEVEVKTFRNSFKTMYSCYFEIINAFMNLVTPSPPKPIKYKVTYFENGEVEVQVIRGRLKVTYLSHNYYGEHESIHDSERFPDREDAQKAIDEHKARTEKEKAKNTKIKSFIID